MKYIIPLLMCLYFLPYTAMADNGVHDICKEKQESKFHIDLLYYYNVGLFMHQRNYSCLRNKSEMGGESLRLYMRYNITPRWSAGIGTGVESYTEPFFNVFPLFSTARFKPFRANKSLKDMYVFTDIGYGIKLFESVTPGLTWKLGMGYTHMWARHFGLTIHVAYDLKSFRYSVGNVNADANNDTAGTITWRKVNNWRHSLSLGIGFAF